MRSLFTIGYEGSSLEDFLFTLHEAGVTTLLDIREIPLSRKKGFSKKALAEALSQVGIEYRHERDLGSPKAVRNQLREDGDYKTYFSDFAKYLSGQKLLVARVAMELSGSTALMCYEKDASTCHRSVVAAHFEKLIGTKTRHLEVHHGTKPKRASANSGKGLSAAKPKV
jgi:uncharacterized protein (DUF488 family)